MNSTPSSPTVSTSSFGRKLKKVSLWTAGSVAVLLLGLAVAVLVREDRKFPAPPSTSDIHASTDPAVIARGRYLAFGPAHCVDCHGDPAQAAERAAGREIPLSGGLAMRLPVGVFHPRNITPDVETGIGHYKDGDIAGILRYGVRPDGTGVLPFMPFADLARDDLIAIISYLRTQAPVHHVVPPHQPNVLGRIVKAFVLEPKGPTMAIRPTMTPAPTAEYGRYLAHSVANCAGCHTPADLRTGAATGPLFSGGTKIDNFITPNLTPDARWGWIATWPEEVFVARIHGGRVREGSPMPWDGFRHMSDTDLQAIFRYLRTLPAAPGGPDPARPETVVAVAAKR